MKLLSILCVLLILAGCGSAPERPQQPVAAPRPTVTAPPSMLGLGPFGLGTPLDTALKQITVPTKTGTDEHGGRYWAYPVSAEGGYMAVLTAPFRPNYVYGVQLSGSSDVNMTPISGVRLGDPESALLANFGEPADKAPETDIGRTLWTYADRNYSFETDAKGRLVSILVYGYQGIMPAIGWKPNWERYIPNSIEAVIEADKSGWESTDYYVPAGGVLFRPRVIYTGQVRNTPPDVMQVLKDFLASSPSNLTPEMYKKSIKVIEDGREYWLPMQEQVITSMPSELKPGDSTDLFAIWAGAKDKGATKVVFVNEYCSCEWVPTKNNN